MALLRTLAWLCLVTAASGKKKASGKKAASVKEELRLTSLSFTDGGEFPSDNLGDEDNVSPNLAWTGAPKNTQSFVLIMDSEKPGEGKPMTHCFNPWGWAIARYTSPPKHCSGHSAA